MPGVRVVGRTDSAGHGRDRETIPTITCLLIGGAVSDRYHRRLLMLTADTARAVILATLAALAVTCALELWEPLVIAVVYGPATAFFNPASDALVQQLLPRRSWPRRTRSTS